VSPIWLNGFFDAEFPNGSTETSDLLDNDFRKSGKIFFNIVLATCNYSKQLVKFGQIVFSQDEFASAKALSRKWIFTLYSTHMLCNSQTMMYHCHTTFYTVFASMFALVCHFVLLKLLMSDFIFH
jgi:hypothetical protein